jgi:hypothetical protein
VSSQRHFNNAFLLVEIVRVSLNIIQDMLNHGDEISELSGKGTTTEKSRRI